MAAENNPVGQAICENAEKYGDIKELFLCQTQESYNSGYRTFADATYVTAVASFLYFVGLAGKATESWDGVGTLLSYTAGLTAFSAGIIGPLYLIGGHACSEPINSTEYEMRGCPAHLRGPEIQRINITKHVTHNREDAWEGKPNKEILWVTAVTQLVSAAILPINVLCFACYYQDVESVADISRSLNMLFLLGTSLHGVLDGYFNSGLEPVY